MAVLPRWLRRNRSPCLRDARARCSSGLGPENAENLVAGDEALRAAEGQVGQERQSLGLRDDRSELVAVALDARSAEELKLDHQRVFGFGSR